MVACTWKYRHRRGKKKIEPMKEWARQRTDGMHKNECPMHMRKPHASSTPFSARCCYPFFSLTVIVGVTEAVGDVVIVIVDVGDCARALLQRATSAADLSRRVILPLRTRQGGGGGARVSRGRAFHRAESRFSCTWRCPATCVAENWNRRNTQWVTFSTLQVPLPRGRPSYKRVGGERELRCCGRRSVKFGWRRGAGFCQI